MSKRRYAISWAFAVLCLFAVPVIFVAKLFSSAVHEVLGHGMTALAVGGRFDGFVIYWTGGGYAEAFAAESASTMSRVAILAGGIVAGIVVGLIFLGLSSRIRSRPFAKLATIVLGATCLMKGLSYALWNSYRYESPPSGDMNFIWSLVDTPWLRWIVFGLVLPVFLVSMVRCIWMGLSASETVLGGLCQGASTRRRRRALAIIAGLASAALWAWNGWDGKLADLVLWTSAGTHVIALTVWAVFSRSQFTAEAAGAVSPRPVAALAWSWGTVTAVVCASFLAGPPRPTEIPEPSPLPSPNGYYDLVRAGELFIVDRDLDDYENATTEYWREQVEKNRESIILVRAALDREIVVPVEYSAAGEEALMSQLTGFRYCYYSLDLTWQLAKSESSVERQMSSALDILRLGVKSYRGGLLLQWLTRTSSQESGISQLAPLRADLNPDQKSRLLRELLRLYELGEPVEEVLKRDRLYDQLATAWRLKGVFVRVRFETGDERNDDYWRIHSARLDALWQLLMTHLAIEIYHDDLGEYPRQIPDLVPQRLPEVPADPFGDGPLTYRRVQDRYVLYSLGDDRRDDGGKRVPRLEYHNKGGDLFLDAYLSEP